MKQETINSDFGVGAILPPTRRVTLGMTSCVREMVKSPFIYGNILDIFKGILNEQFL